MNRYSKLSLLAAAIAAAGTVAYAAQGGIENDAMAITRAKIPMAQAVTTAEQHANGKASRAEYENSKQGLATSTSFHDWSGAHPDSPCG